MVWLNIWQCFKNESNKPVEIVLRVFRALADLDGDARVHALFLSPDQLVLVPTLNYFDR